MTFARIGTGSGKVLLDSAANPAVVTGLAATAGGELVVCCGSFNGASVNITSVTSNVGGTWSFYQSALSAGNNRTFTAWCLNAPAGVTQVSLTGTGGSPYGVASLDKYSFSGSATKDQNNSAVNVSVSTTVPLSSGTITNSQAAALLVGAYGSDDSAAGTVTLGGSGTWTTLHTEGDTTTHHASGAAFQIVSGSTGPYNFTGLYDQETAQGACSIVSFVESGGGGGAVDNPRNYQDGVPGAYYTDPGYSALYGREQQGIPLANRDSAAAPTIAAGAGSIASAATVQGVGASINSGAFSETSVATVTGVPNAISAASVISQAVSALTGVGASTNAAVISAAGSVTVLGVSNNGGTISAGAGSISSIATVQGVGASTVSADISEAATASATGVGASTAAAVISAAGTLVATGDGSNGVVVVSAAGSISISASVNGEGASSVTAVAQAAAVVTVTGASTTSNLAANTWGSARRHAIRAQQQADDDAALLDLAALLVPLISQGGPLWAH